jgi:NADH:ubiquinone oxidoreductase subunit 6 (subunit J)
MDSLHAIGFYASSFVSLAGGIGVALLPGRDLRGTALAVAGLGIAGAYLSLSAGFAAVIAIVCYAGCAYFIAGPQYRPLEALTAGVWRQLGAIASAVVLALLAFAAFRGNFASAKFFGGEFDTAAVGRLLFAHDAIATEAVAILVLVGIAGAAATWRLRAERGR